MRLSIGVVFTIKKQLPCRIEKEPDIEQTLGVLTASSPASQLHLRGSFTMG